MGAFSFLNPSFLWALPVAAIPLVIHFLSKRRIREVRFPTVMFLRTLEPREIRRLRLREILILIARTLALVALVLAFARPSVEPAGSVAHAAAAVALVVDDTASLGAQDDRARPREAGARARALALVDAARPGDEIGLVAASRPDAPLTTRSGDRVRSRRWAEQLVASAIAHPLGPALESAGRLLARSALRVRELYVVSDFQGSSWPPEARAALLRASAAPGVRTYLLPLVQGRVPNHGFVDLDPELRPGPKGRGLELAARLANHADAPSERIALRVRRGEALIGGGDVSLRPDETRWTSMPIEWNAGGQPPPSPTVETSVIIEADEDAFRADDSWYAVLGPPRRLTVLRIAESRAGAPPPRFAALALDPGGDGGSGIAVESATPAALLTLRPGRTDVVLLEDIAALSEEAESRLRAFLRSGGGLVVAFGPHADPAYYGQRLFPGLVDLAVDGVERAPQGGSFELRARSPGHPILEGLSVGLGSPLSQARLTAIARGRARSPRAAVVVSTPGGLPVVVAATGVAVCLGSLADDWGDLPYTGAFVPLLRGMIEHAARTPAGDALVRPTVGARPTARLAALPPGAVAVRGPASYRSQASVVAEGAGFRAVADQLARTPGFYTFSAENRPLATVAVNVDPIESDLAPLPLDSLRAGGGDRIEALPTLASLSSHVTDSRRGRELWLPFLLAGAVFLAAELLLSSARILKP